ncbi:MAG TPA: Coenzyme F420 hydrogenase/dehydrogenase, beta subunit C-terminal domain [Devosiaceae bacterium]
MTALGTITVAQLPEVVKTGQCMGCGFCQLPVGDTVTPAAIGMRYSPEDEYWVPEISKAGAEMDPEDLRICPGARMDMRALSEAIFGELPADPMVAEAKLIASGHATDDNVRRNAASGGVTSAILGYLFTSGSIDVAYCTNGRSPDSGRGMLVRSAADLKSMMGSHYHPVNFGDMLPELADSTSRFAFVGLPCEVAALRQLLAARPDLAKRCVLVIGLFCGGINRFSGIADYLRNFGVDRANVTGIDYRDGPWPGRIRLTATDGSDGKTVPRILGNSRWNILRYVIAFQGYSMLPRCRICPDQIADFADIAVGDPHLGRFKEADSPGHSAIIARTATGLVMLEAAVAAGAVVLGDLSRDELVRSQGYTLENRRHAPVYVRMARCLGMTPPEITVYDDLEKARSPHQNVYALVDLLKIKWRGVKFLRPFHLVIQVFEYLFLTFSIRILLSRLKKLVSGR